MASKTKKTKLIRKRKESRRGRDRKRLTKRKGSTQSYKDLFGEK